MPAWLVSYAGSFVQLFVAMAPYLLLGFFFAGLLHAFFPGDTLARHLGKPGWRSSLKSALLGVPLPLCSCGVIPTALSLRKHGASPGATVSFLIATPQTGVDSILATSALLGWPMAVVRPVAAFVTGVLGGIFTDRGQAEKPVATPIFKPVPTGKQPLLRPVALASGGAVQVRMPQAMAAMPAPMPSKGASCASDGCSDAPITVQGFFPRMREALRYGFLDMLSGIVVWLLVGLAVAALIGLVVPESFFTQYLSNYWLSVGLVLLVAIPLYVCATGSIPIALALMLKGMSPGVAFVFLMAGPATMASTIAVVGKALGRRTLWLYLTSIIAGAVFFGYAIDHWLPASWFVPPMLHAGHGAHGEHVWLPAWASVLSALSLAGLMLYALWQRRPRRSSQAGEAELAALPVKVYTVKTITCANCQRHLERDVGALPGVNQVKASVQPSTLTVWGTVSEEAVRAAVKKAGYQVEGVES